MTRKQERRKKRAKKLRLSLFIFILIITALTCFCLFTPFFNLQTVTVTGNNQLTEEEIISQSGVPYGENIFRISKRNIKKNLSALSHIESVKVSRIPLSKIKISIKETNSDFVLVTKNGFAGVNTNGKVIELFSSQDEFDLPLILGIEAEMAKVSEKISVQDTITFDIIIDNIKLFKEKGFLNEMSTIDFSDLSSTQGYLKGGTKVIFGKLTDLDYKLSVLLAILPQVDASEGAYIDLSTPSNAFYGREEDIVAPQSEQGEPEAETGEQNAEVGEKESGSEQNAEVGEKESGSEQNAEVGEKESGSEQNAESVASA